jgi:putative ABC transport system ATP-binding protein
MQKKLFENLNSQEVWQKLLLVLRPERSFYFTTIIYSIGVSILSLGVPISVQALVNTVTFGVLLQPLVVLSFVLLALLVFSGALNALQYYIVEIFQRHIYTRITVDMTMKLLNVKFKDLERQNSTKLINRYFDVMTIQKSVTTLLTGGIDIILQTFVGLLLLAFYHPYFLAFDFVLVIFLWLSWVLFWKRAVQTAVYESKSKYEVASWLEEMSRLNLFFKTEKRKRYALEKADTKVLDYIENRTRHFKYSFMQNITLLATYAFMSAFVLGLGGFLVIEGELTIGQLVAAELVVTVILYNFAKSGKYLLSFYDLYAAVDKISVFYDLKSEDNSERFELEKDDLFTFDLDLQDVEIKTSSSDITISLKALKNILFTLSITIPK